MSSTGSLIPRVYSNFRGVDFRGEEINLVRSPDSLNVWKDYKETESIRTRPAMKRLASLVNQGKIYQISFFKGEMLVHIGSRICKYADGELTNLYTNALQNQSESFVYEDPKTKEIMWYFKDGKNYLQYDGNEIAEVEGYIPTTSIGRKPVEEVTDKPAGGTIHEDINMLQPKRINTFVGDGKSTVYWLDADKIDNVKPVVKFLVLKDDKVVWEVQSAYSTDYENGRIVFVKAPDAPLTDGQDNVSIEFSKTVDGYREAILNCRLVQPFDNRVFFSGNKDHPNMVWHTSLNDPTYVSDLDYYREGMDTARVTGMVAGNNALWVFREPSEANTNVFYHTPAIDDDYGKIYPSSHSSVATGCVGKAINFNDDIVFFSERGMEGISGDITTEQVVAHRSSMVDRKLTAEKNYANMLLVEWEGYLLVIIGKKVYLADSRGVFTNEDHIEYEWFYWQMEKEITCARAYEGTLYLGTTDGIYELTDLNSDVESYWVTPKDKFNYPHMQKTTNKKGCVAEATGDITVYAKVEDTDFQLIGEYENVKDYFVSRIKRKKFKDIQLKFHSKTRFSLETVTLEVWVGGYIKR